VSVAIHVVALTVALRVVAVAPDVTRIDAPEQADAGVTYTLRLKRATTNVTAVLEITPAVMV
jgi:hypothetical protein